MMFPLPFLPDRDFDVVGFGTNAFDHLIRVPGYPAFNSKIEMSGYTQSAGGEIATTLTGLQRLGRRTAYAGRFGADEAGKIGLTTLTGEGVDTEFCEIVPEARTQIAFILIDETTGERTIIWHRDERLTYAAADAPLDLVGRGRILHITPHDTAAAIRMAQKARAGGVIVSLDIDNVFAGVEDLLPLVDILVASAEFPSRFTGTRDCAAALAEIAAEYKCAIVGVTLGEAGSLLRCDRAVINTPGMSAPGGCVDTTGAGDAFRVGLLYGLLRGDPIEEAARTANAVAALKCSAPGARTGLPDEVQLRRFMSG